MQLRWSGKRNKRYEMIGVPGQISTQKIEAETLKNNREIDIYQEGHRVQQHTMQIIGLAVCVFDSSNVQKSVTQLVYLWPLPTGKAPLLFLLRGSTIAIITPMRQARTCGRVWPQGPTSSAPKQSKLDVHVNGQNLSARDRH